MKVSTRKYWQRLIKQTSPGKDRRKANGKQRKAEQRMKFFETGG